MLTTEVYCMWLCNTRSQMSPREVWQYDVHIHVAVAKSTSRAFHSRLRRDADDQLGWRHSALQVIICCALTASEQHRVRRDGRVCLNRRVVSRYNISGWVYRGERRRRGQLYSSFCEIAIGNCGVTSFPYLW